MSEPEFLDIEEVLEIHALQLAAFGGLERVVQFEASLDATEVLTLDDPATGRALGWPNQRRPRMSGTDHRHARRPDRVDRSADGLPIVTVGCLTGLHVAIRVTKMSHLSIEWIAERGGYRAGVEPRPDGLFQVHLERWVPGEIPEEPAYLQGRGSDAQLHAAP